MGTDVIRCPELREDHSHTENLIMLTSSIRFVAAACIATWVLLPSAHAQSAQQQSQSSKPEKMDEADASAQASEPHKPQREITEKRERGNVTEVKVQSRNSTYYLKPSDAAGAPRPTDNQRNLQGAQWRVMQFDWGKRKENKKPDAAQAGTPQADAPAPPPAQK